MANIRVYVFVSGRVQGVFFRQKTKRQAEYLGVTGWVRNLDDGRVEAVFEGEESDIEALVDFCRRGQRDAVISKVEVAVERFTGEFQSFEVVY
jgi:acylphosphatase